MRSVRLADSSSRTRSGYFWRLRHPTSMRIWGGGPPAPAPSGRRLPGITVRPRSDRAHARPVQLGDPPECEVPELIVRPSVHISPPGIRRLGPRLPDEQVACPRVLPAGGSRPPRLRSQQPGCPRVYVGRCDSASRSSPDRFKVGHRCLRHFNLALSSNGGNRSLRKLPYE